MRFDPFMLAILELIDRLCHLRLLRCAYRLHVYKVVADAARGSGILRGPGSGIAPNLLPAVQWNIFAWLAWGVLIVSIRYAAERRRQITQQQAAVQSLKLIA